MADAVSIHRRVLNRLSFLMSAMANFGLGQQERAEFLLSACVKTCGRQPGASKPFARLLLNRGERAQATDLLETVVRAAPNDADALAMLATACVQDRKYGQASVLPDRAVQASGGRPRPAMSWRRR